MRKYWIGLESVILCIALLPAPVTAGEEQTFDRVSFQVEVGDEVDNDRLVVVLNVTAENKLPANLADTLNDTMQWALEQAHASHDVRVRSGSYQTYPVYDDRKIVNWRGRQELYLESGNVDELTRLVGVLQNRLQMQSLQFSVSPELQAEVEERLIEQSLRAYQKRAAIISKSLGAKSYRLLDIRIDSGSRPPVLPLRAEAAMVSRANVSPPALESGSSRISVQAGGAIQLVRD